MRAVDIIENYVSLNLLCKKDGVVWSRRTLSPLLYCNHDMTFQDLVNNIQRQNEELRELIRDDFNMLENLANQLKIDDCLLPPLCGGCNWLQLEAPIGPRLLPIADK